MKKFISTLAVFLSPFLIAIIIEICFLPVDFFTFRTWEAISGSAYYKKALGPFYPNIQIDRIEEGDLAHHTPYAVKKEVRWITDKYGYRKQNSMKRNEIIIVGDSNAVGSGLSQEEILSEVLEKKINRHVYPYAPAGFKSYFYEKRFLDNPPDVVIFQIIEREIISLQSPHIPNQKLFVWINRLRETIREFHLQPVAIFLDRAFIKMNMLNYLKASIKPKEVRGIIGKGEIEEKRMIFLQGKSAHAEISLSQIAQIIKTLKQYASLFREKGIRFIFVPIPNKETIYYRNIPALKKRSFFLSHLINELKKTDVEYLNTLELFNSASQSGQKLLYFSDDSHWNAKGVELVSQLLYDRLTSDSSH